MFRLLGSLFIGGCLFATSPSIGTVRSNGDFRLDGNTIHGNTTLFDGSLIETTSARSVVELGGVQVTLSPDSRARVYHDRTILEKGTGVVRDDGNHTVEAATLHVHSFGKGSLLQIEVSGPNHVSVAARIGSAEVRSATGTLVARMRTGMALAFDPQSSVPVATTLNGIVVETKDGAFTLTDVTTNVTSELRGSDLARHAGHKVQITGSTDPTATPKPGASQVVLVTTIGKAAAVAGGGTSTVAIVAIVGGVAAGGTVAGLAAAGTFHSSSAVSRP